MTPPPVRKAPTTSKTCLVTVGATTTFHPLLLEVLTPPFTSTLLSASYTHLLLQCGPSKPIIDEIIANNHIASYIPEALTIETFNLIPDLVVRMRATTPGPGNPTGETRTTQEGPVVERYTGREKGVVIGHAGTGTIIDALSVGARLIVVPNPELKGNHQMEIAEEFEKMGKVVLGMLGKLPETLEYSENTPTLPSAEDVKTDEPSINLVDVLGILALSGEKPEEFKKQLKDAAIS